MGQVWANMLTTEPYTTRAPGVLAVLWVERKPTERRWIDLCQRVGVILAWPGGIGIRRRSELISVELTYVDWGERLTPHRERQ